MPLDPRGPNCPFPALWTRKMPSRLAYGERLSVKCTDPLAIDIPHRPRETGDTLECREAARGLFFIFHVKRGKAWEQHFLPVARRCGGIPAPFASSGFIMEKPFHPASHLRFLWGSLKASLRQSAVILQ
jgi:tRNA 2-thiouridine synthesizing protein A